MDSKPRRRGGQAPALQYLSLFVRRGPGAVGLQATATRGTGPRATIPLTFCRARACPSPTPSTGDRQEPANLPNRPDGSSGAPAPEEAGSGELALQKPHLVNPVNPDSEKKKTRAPGTLRSYRPESRTLGIMPVLVAFERARVGCLAAARTVFFSRVVSLGP